MRAVRALACLAALAASPAAAQNRIVAQADAAFASGDVALADSLYYVAVRVRPRDPEARAALGRYLAAHGRAKVAVVLLEEARMFGGDPSAIAHHLVPLYTWLGEWRALLTLPGSPLTGAERRRAGWLSERPFGASSEGGAASIIGSPKGDTLARVAVRINGRAAVAAIVGTDDGFVVGSRITAGAVRRFEGDSMTVAFDSVTVGQVKFVNVPAAIGTAASTMTIGVTALARLVVQIDYARNRIAMTRTDGGHAEARYQMVRTGGQLRVLNGGRWVPLGDFAAAIAKASKTIVIDVGAGEVRIRP